MFWVIGYCLCTVFASGFLAFDAARNQTCDSVTEIVTLALFWPLTIPIFIGVKIGRR